MGKQRRQRRKLHLTASPEKPEITKTTQPEDYQSAPLKFTPDENIFKNINLASSLTKTALFDDTRSVKSFKSMKSDKSGDKQLTKKEKLKLRKEFLLRKIDTVKQMKKEAKLREKRKKTAVLGDTNPLHDALPSLESLLKSRPVARVVNEGKPKGIQKAAKRRKNYIQGTQIFKQILSNELFKKDPLSAVSEHVKAVVEQEKSKQKSC